MEFVPVLIALFFAIIFAPILPKGRRGRRRSSKRRGGVMCGPGGCPPRGKKFRMTGKKIW